MKINSISKLEKDSNHYYFYMEDDNDKLPVVDCGVKARSKIEVYRVLTTEGGVYLPPAKECNYKWIRAIITGEKLVRRTPSLHSAHQREERRLNYCSTIQMAMLEQICNWAQPK